MEHTAPFSLNIATVKERIISSESSEQTKTRNQEFELRGANTSKE